MDGLGNQPLSTLERQAADEHARHLARLSHMSRIARRAATAVLTGALLLLLVAIGTLIAAPGNQPPPLTPAFSPLELYKEYTSTMPNDFNTTSTACASSCGLPTNDEELRKLLSPEQYKIMRENGTEAPFRNEYWNNKAEGIYVDRITGRPLFSSKDKFDSGTGWPSFTKPLHSDELKEIVDRTHGMTRTEVRSKSSDSHLGHVFDDGPASTGLRYCMNSASLKFIPVERLAEEGLADYLPLFGKGATGEASSQNLQQAMFGAGCFWGVEEVFRTTPGVVETAVGYAGGQTANPTYKEVCTDTTGHAEVVHVTFNPAEVSYDQLLEIFWKNHNPTQLNRQGPDVGTQYRSVIFVYTPEQEKAARESKERLGLSGRWGKPIVTQIVSAAPFHRAEEYHQKYLQKRGISACH